MKISNEIKAKIFAQYLGQKYNHKVKVFGEWEYRGEFEVDGETIDFADRL